MFLPWKNTNHKHHSDSALEIIQNALVGIEYCLLHTVQYTGYTSLFNEVFLGYESICIIYSSMLCFLHDFIPILI